MERRIVSHLFAGALAACLLAGAAQPGLTAVVFDDHFTGNSGGIPANWFRVFGTGAVVEAGTTVTLGDDLVVIGSNATIDPNSGTVRIETDIVGVAGQVGSGLFVPGTFPGTFILCELRSTDNRIEVSASDDVGSSQNYDLGYLVGYSGGPIRLTLIVGPTSFSVSTDSPPFSSGEINYSTAFPTFTRSKLGNAASVWLFDFENPGSSIIDRITVDIGPPVPVPDAVATAWLAIAAYPNPFNPMTTLRFDLPVAGSVRLAVYDVAGRLLKVLVDGEMAASSHEAVWDGRDAGGREMASGSYFARLETTSGREITRMMLIR